MKFGLRKFTVGDQMAFHIVEMENKKPLKISPYLCTTWTAMLYSNASVHRTHHPKRQLQRLRHCLPRTPWIPHWLQWCGPNSPAKVPLPVDRLPNPNTCLIHGTVRPMVPNSCRLRSAVFPQCTGQTDRPTDRSFMGTFDDYRPLRSESDAA